MSNGQRRWAAAPGGICSERDPCNRIQAPVARRAPATWDVVGRRVLEVARETPAVSRRLSPPSSGSAAAVASIDRS